MTQTRQEKFAELESLIQLQACSGMRENTFETVQDIIDELLEELYPVCTGEAVTCKREDCCQRQEVSDEIYSALMGENSALTYEDFMAAINEAAEIEIEYMTLQEGLSSLINFKGGRLARKGWDNGLNHEYVEYVPMVGAVKVYQTSTVKPAKVCLGEFDTQPKSYFKNVMHTFEPTKDDETANDWYFL